MRGAAVRRYGDASARWCAKGVAVGPHMLLGCASAANRSAPRRLSMAEPRRTAARAHPEPQWPRRKTMNWIYVHDLNPVLVQLGPLRIGWYGLMYAIAFITGYWYLLRESRKPGSPVTTEDVPNLFTYLILGVILGGRLGWVVFYGGLPYLYQPYRILETWKGGMSFHGGLIGVMVALWLFARSRKQHFWAVGDFMLTWVPVGLFLGRIGNFINGELWGKPTDGSWGVIFPHDPLQVPRHPSQLYEALLEGGVIFVVLFIMRGRVHRRGSQAAVFFTLYGLARIVVEFVRVPDADIGYLWGFITMGQLLSLPVLLIGIAWCAYVFTRPPQALPEDD
jgi:phosphatidylglycerol---prolipoprotein diacylglyceryl transferase